MKFSENEPENKLDKTQKNEAAKDITRRRTKAIAIQKRTNSGEQSRKKTAKDTSRRTRIQGETLRKTQRLEMQKGTRRATQKIEMQKTGEGGGSVKEEREMRRTQRIEMGKKKSAMIMKMSVMGSVVVILAIFALVQTNKNPKQIKKLSSKSIEQPEEIDSDQETNKKVVIDSDQETNKKVVIDSDQETNKKVTNKKKDTKVNDKLAQIPEKNTSPKQKEPIVAKEIEEKKPLTLDEIYKKKLKKSEAKGTTSSYLKLARWCKKQGMDFRANDIYHKVIGVAPNNSVARKALGYVKIRSSWVKKDDAHRLGYYEYDGRWFNAKELKARGLIYYNSEWLTTRKAKNLGLVEHKGRWMTLAEKDKLSHVRLAKTENRAKPVKETPNRKKHRVTIPYNMIRLTTPLGYWSKGVKSHAYRAST